MNNTNGHVDPTTIWPDCCADLERELSPATYKTLFVAGTFPTQNNGTVSINIPSSLAVETLTKREKINQRAGDVIRRHYGVEGVEFVYVEPKRPAFVPVADEYEPDPNANIEGNGVYSTEKDAIIDPNSVMVFKQYFRLKWWPILGPVTALLIMDLRQRCYYKGGRTTFKTTFKELGEAIGVSDATVKRILQRDKFGKFKKPHIDKFVHKVEIVKKKNTINQVYNTGIKITVYLDEPLTPDDERKLQ